MSNQRLGLQRPITRRAFVRGVGSAGIATVAVPTLWFQPDVSAADQPEQLHLQFGSDASREVIASWATGGSVKNPRVRLGTPKGGLGRSVNAETRTYLDQKSGVEVFTHHARLDGLHPATTYIYEALHDGAVPLDGSFTTAPRGRSKLRFTSFGDQATPNPGNGLWSPWAGYNPLRSSARSRSSIC